MRSPLVLLVFTGCVVLLLPKPALGALVPIFVYRALPTSSPTSSPSYEPSFRPSSQPTCEPSLSPSSRPSLRPSLKPSPQPSSQPTSNPSSSPSTQPTLSPQPSSLSMSSSYMMRSEATSEPSSFGFWLITSVIGIVILLFFVCVWLQCVRKNKNKQCLPCFVVRGAKISEDKMQDKVQQKQSNILPPTEAEAGAEVEQVLDKVRQKQNDTLPPTPTEAEGEQDGWAAVFSPVMALGGFFSSMVSPVQPQEELSPKEPSNPLPSLLTKSSSRFNSVSSDVRVSRPQTSPQRKDSESNLTFPFVEVTILKRDKPSNLVTSLSSSEWSEARSQASNVTFPVVEF